MSKSFEEMKEIEIIHLAQDGNNGAMDFLLEKYKGMVRVLSRPLFLIGGDKDDLVQEGMIGLFKAIRNYDAEKGTIFETFANQCITRQMYTAIKSSNRKKNIPLNYYVSIYTPDQNQANNGPDGDFMVDKFLESLQKNPEEIVIGQESAENMERRLFSRLSTMETEVLKLFLKGMTYQEIAAELDKTPKTIDNALQRIKMKLSKLRKHNI